MHFVILEYFELDLGLVLEILATGEKSSSGTVQEAL